MKVAKALLSIAGVSLVIYLGVFFFWLASIASCLDYADQHDWQDGECGQNDLTQMVRTTHAPLIALMVGSNN